MIRAKGEICRAHAAKLALFCMRWGPGGGRLDDRNYTCIVVRGTVGEALDKRRGSTETDLEGFIGVRSSPGMRNTMLTSRK